MDLRGPITLGVTVYSADPAVPPSAMQQITLQPGEFQQLNGVLSTIGATDGYVKVERLSGTAGYYAYGVVNDAYNSDGSFIPPKVDSSNVPAAMTVPVVVDTGVYSTELVLTNYYNRVNTLTLRFVAGNVTSADHAAATTVSLAAGQQLTIANIITYLRSNGASAALPTGQTYAGPLYVTSSNSDLAGIAVGARTLNPNPNGSGRFGLFYPAMPFGSSSANSAWLYGLQQNETNRTNLAILNTGEVNDDTDAFEIDIYNGDTGQKLGSPVTTDNSGNPLTFSAKQWKQINMILANKTSGVRNAYVQVRRVSGSNPFITYAVINDGASPGLRTGDGAFIST
jgi:hypothetical protein